MPLRGKARKDEEIFAGEGPVMRASAWLGPVSIETLGKTGGLNRKNIGKSWENLNIKESFGWGNQ